VDFFHRLKIRFKRLKSQRFEDWLCLRHQVKNGGGIQVKSPPVQQDDNLYMPDIRPSQ
jgi:hypothetical protein